MNWETKKFGNVCDFVRGPFGGALKKNIFKETGYAVYEQQHAINDQFESIRYFVDKEKFEEMPRFELFPGDLIMSCSGTMGKIAIAPDSIHQGIINQALLKLSPKEYLDSKFLKLWMESKNFQDQIEYMSQGVAIKNMASVKILKEIKVPLPPIPDQKRIVAILEQAFADIEKARALTEQNLKNARELFESYLQQMFSQRGEGWVNLNLQELLDRKWITSHLDGNHGGDYPRKDEFIQSGVPYISANCIVDDEIDFSKAKYLSPERASMLRKGIAKDNDVIFAHNATVGPVAILSTPEEKVVLGTSLTYYRCDKNHILPQYLAQYMRTNVFSSQYKKVMQQSTRNQVPITKQREFFHLIPPIDQQVEFSRVLIDLEEQRKRLIKLYHLKLGAFDELKKSLLQKAFSGELTKDREAAAG